MTKHDDAHAEEDQGLERERREDQAERHHGAEVGDEARSQDRLAVFGGVEAELEHHRVDDGDRRRRHRDAGEPARHDLPAKQIVGARRSRGTGRRSWRARRPRLPSI